MKRVSDQDSAARLTTIEDLDDGMWDAFLESTPLGQFQQSSMWAQAKQADGWQPIRRGVAIDGRLVGGFQILARRLRWGRVGYIYKGPVIAPEDRGTTERVLGLVADTARANHLHALIVQPPDESTADMAMWAARGYLPNHLKRIISATLLVDLADGLESVRQRMRRNTRTQVRQAMERGVTTRLGGDADISRFFGLLKETCLRQRTTPSPASASALLAIWKAFRTRDKVKLFLAEYQGESVAGLLCFCFGGRVTAWKKGWSGAHDDRNPNHLVNYEAIRWACQHGFKSFDFDEMDRALATAMLRGEKLSPAQSKCRDFFNLGFGNRPRLLPPSRAFITNPLLRWFYGRSYAAPCIEFVRRL